MRFVGRSGNNALFSSNGLAAVVDERLNIVLSVDSEASMSSGSWMSSFEEPTKQAIELANAALTDLDIKVLSSVERMHTIPKSVQEEARRALEWRKEFKRGGTPVGLNTARTLAGGGQIGIKKIRHIAKYFPRHEVDKKGKGYKPGDPSYPSKGRIAWALWGGDAAQKWASAIVERENKKENSSLVASHGYYDFETPLDVDFPSFASESNRYMARVRMDGSGIDRLYCVSSDGTVLVWDDGSWSDLGNICHDIETYDKSLDDPYDSVEKSHVPIDAEAAVMLAALFDADPFSVRSLEMVAPEETILFSDARNEMDFSIVDAIIAAPAAQPGFKTNQDGTFTPEERSEKATAQLRDAMGRFAVTGSRVAVGGDPNLKGKIISQDNASQTVKVQLDDGKYIDIAANQTQQEDTLTNKPVEQGRQPGAESNLFGSNPIDTSGILGEPRTPIGYAAQMPGTLPALSRESVSLLLSDFPAWVASQRVSEDTAKTVAAPERYKRPDREGPDLWYEKEKPKGLVFKNAMNDPLLRGFLENPKNRGWYTFDITEPESVEAQKSFEDVYKTKKAREQGGLTLKKKKDGSYTYDPDYKDGWQYSRTSKSSSSSSNGSSSSSSSSSSSRGSYSAEGFTAAGETAKDETYTNPRQSDVAPMYMAIVAEDDPQAVLELIALVPKSATSTSPMVFKRQPGQWVPDESILKDLNSPTPPPVIMLETDVLEDVVKQIDGPEIEAARQMEAQQEAAPAPVAAGGFYRGGPNAERLRRYWVQGRGASKVRWGSSGDWERCVRKVSMHLGARAEAYCSLMYKDATGSWITDRQYPVTASAGVVGQAAMPTEDEVVSFIAMKAQRSDAKNRIVASGVAYDVNEHPDGTKFSIPLVIPEDVESGDGRIFTKKSITIRDLPLPLLWQIKTGDGHNGSVVVGKIDRMERTDDGIGNAYGVFDSGVYGKEAERLVRGRFLRGVSADLDQFEADEEDDDKSDTLEDGKISKSRMKISKARVMAVTLVPKPAFQECLINIYEDSEGQEDSVVPDGVYVDEVDAVEASALVACGIVAGVIPTTPPAEWFENPQLRNASPLTVTDEGRVFGHIAAWNVDHIGMAFGTRAPKSRSNYAYFHSGVVRTEDGTDVPVGQLTLAGGHASLEASAQQAVRHYDDTASAIADVHAGEDAFGIWVSGALRPGTTPEQIRALRASAPSGDWRPIKGHLELVAVCQVNVPGFPIARARVASGQVLALVAAGAQTLARMKDDPVTKLSERIARLEDDRTTALVASMQVAQARVLSIKAEELASKMKKAKKDIQNDSDYMVYGVDDGNPDEELAIIPRRLRRKLAEEGKALPDGSFPIRNVSDLRNAVQSYGRAKVGSRAKVRNHIMKRARSLDRSDLVPEEWKQAASISASVMSASSPETVEESDPLVASLRERAAIVESMIAAGGADRNRGNAEQLRRYWTVGKGALKIRWGTPGDWTRCVRYLSKYMGVRAKGYCQLRHKEATGVYTGSKLNPGRDNSVFSAFSEQDMTVFKSLYGDPSQYTTEVTEMDMMMPLDQIMADQDDLYDTSWTPPGEVVMLIKTCGYTPYGEGPEEDEPAEDSEDTLDTALNVYEDE